MFKLSSEVRKSDAQKRPYRRCVGILAGALAVLTLGACSATPAQEAVNGFGDAFKSGQVITTAEHALIASNLNIRDAIHKGRAVLEAKLREEILKNTVYVKADNKSVYAAESLAEPAAGNFKKGTSFYVVSRKAAANGSGELLQVKRAYEDAATLGWMDSNGLAASRSELIQSPYAGADYEAFVRPYEYPENPRVKVKGVYVTGHSAAGAKLEQLIQLADTTDINAFVIDVLDDNGHLLFKSDKAEEFVPGVNDKVYIKDMEAFIKRLKEKDIYLIARIVTFKSPKFAKAHPERAITVRATGQPYVGNDKILWVSPHDRMLWDYNVSVAEEAARLGFDEIQFDYVRFPASNGGKLDASLDYRNPENETKTAAIQKFLVYAHERLSPLGVYTAADVFGWAASSQNDVGIGQHWEAISNVVDYLCPMMYPSHYGPGNYGFAVPDANPYGVIDKGIKDSLDRNLNIETPGTLRPWIQDFTATWVRGHIRYGEVELRAQIEALKANGVDEYLLWNAGNSYTSGALK
ncbi:MAG: hypothetical protein GT601_00425 [Acidaminobacter sp.]|uniref:putative glycoside hydrolase n=1 Tax=Acidaminobacter sp. TaxID=1872102 RepID=UPI001385F22E|nr:putative glycoside hydrolase [Acidaminobacter sp.]MZQ96134.1 hypothetical protein [Acidaminobacter sp.]